MIRPERKNEPGAPLTARKLGASSPSEPSSKKYAAKPTPTAHSDFADGAETHRFTTPKPPRKKSSSLGSSPRKKAENERPKPRPARKMTEQRVRNIAEHYVASRECTQQMLREVLNRRQMRRHRELPEDEQQTESVDAEIIIEAEIMRLVKAGLIDDARYAEGRARADLMKGRGARRIMMDLALKGVSKDVAEDALKEASREVTGTLGRNDVDDDEVARSAEWEAADTFARKKRYGPYRTSPLPEDYMLSQKIWRREASAMARQGFGLDLINQIIDRSPEEDTF